MSDHELRQVEQAEICASSIIVMKKRLRVTRQSEEESVPYRVLHGWFSIIMERNVYVGTDAPVSLACDIKFNPW